MATTKPPRATATPRANGAKRPRAATPAAGRAAASSSAAAAPSIAQQRDMLALMHLIRTFEDAAAREYARGNVAGFLHLYNGCEASGVGVLSAIRPDDFAMGNYRDHGHALARGVPAENLMAELFGRVDGVCKGRGGSMHFFSKEHNYLGGWAIVGGQLPVSVGYQFATEYKRTVLKQDVDSIGVCFLGEGSTNIGYFYETMNFAKLWHVPVVFVVENNLYAMGTPLAFHSSVHSMADKGRGFGIESETCDGMDVLAVHAAMSDAAQRARTTREPQLLEVMTYRYRAHSMADPDLYRTKEEIESWRRKDAIERLKHALLEGDHLTEDEFAAMVKVNEKTVADAVAFANASPEPPLSDLMAYITVPPPTAEPPAADAETAELSMSEALNAAIDHWMAETPAAFVMGEDIDHYGSAYGVTRGLPAKFGEDRVRDTPIAEGAIGGIATGAAMGGIRPLAEFMTVNFALLASDAIINHAAKVRSMFGDQTSAPVVFRANAGGTRLGATHSQHFDAMFAAVPGLTVAAPATPYDAKGMLAMALRMEDPVFFNEHQLLYRAKGKVPVGHYTLPVGKAHVERAGAPGGLTLVGYSRGLVIALEAAERLAKEFGIEAEVINLRWLRPLDHETVVESVKKTNRVAIVEEPWLSYGIGAEVAARVQQHAFDFLDAPIIRVGGAEAPMPYAANLERAAWPSAEGVIAALKANGIIR
ncbi:MAG: pyruvate dehydrogenase complex E1 component subunit beta [Anaerolineae bacterium]